MESIQQLTSGMSDLVSLPQVGMRVIEMVESPKYSAMDIGKAISQDPGLTARLLKIANSPFYGQSARIDTVSRAVTLLGSQQIRNLVIATTTIHAFDGIPNDLISMEDFWYHSIACGLAAKYLSTQLRGIEQEAMFIAGLLHDIGQLVIFNKLPEQAREVLLHVEDDPEEPEIYQIEARLLGFDHAQVGMELLKQWHLPPLFQECTAYHHNIEMASEYPREVALIHIANSIAVMAELNSTHDEHPAINERAWEISGLDREIIEPAMQEVQEQVRQMQNLLLG